MADIFGSTGSDTLTGTTESDIIIGGEGNDNIDGNFGSDTIEGGSGNDSLLGAPGNDILVGGIGNDSLTGGGGNDTLNGTDSLAAGAGEIDTLSGNQNNDTFIVGDTTQVYYQSSGNSDYALIKDFNPLQDVIQLKGIPSDYTVIQVGSDVELLYHGELIARLTSQSTSTLDLNATYFRYVGSGVDLVGSAGDDLLEGGSGFDNIQGADGNDTIRGADGRDSLSGDAGSDMIDGGEGNDSINGGDGNDFIDGGVGNDTVDAGFNDDTVLGGAGHDVINGAPGFDTVSGGAGNDSVSGGGQDDSLCGTDAIAAGAGEQDVVTGGSGNDRFILGDRLQAYYTATGDADYARITDFSLAGDVIELYGKASDYQLAQTGSDVEIRYKGELIGLLANRTAADYDLTGAAFNYVLSSNTPPRAIADEVTTLEDTSITIPIAELLSNDQDADGNSLTLTEVCQPVNGTVKLDGYGNVIFTPDADFSGAASFDYTISDGRGGQASATVAVTVQSVPDNTAPTTNGIESFVVTNNAPTSVINLFNAFDDLEDGSEKLSYSILSVSNSSVLNQVTIDHLTGSLSIDYACQASGSSEIVIRATDQGGQSVDASFNVSVLNATWLGDDFSGCDGNDYLNGEFGSDRLAGWAGNDTLRGGMGSDFLTGNSGNDVLEGASRLTGGWLEKDTLTGGTGSDTFVLGNQSRSYYANGYGFDYALIQDFSATEDKLVMQGCAGNYSTKTINGDTYLYQKQSSWFSWFSWNQDLVAVFDNTTSLDLHSSAIEYLG